MLHSGEPSSGSDCTKTAGGSVQRRNLKKEIYHQQLAALKRSEQAAMDMSVDGEVDDYDNASVSADSVDSSSFSDETGTDDSTEDNLGRSMELRSEQSTERSASSAISQQMTIQSPPRALSP